MAKILMIEDNEEILEEVLTWLSLEEYEAIGATDGQQGIDLALQQHPDLILSDIMMPKKDGHRVLLELRTHPATALTPFIFTTAKQAKVDIRYGMEMGADDYITKPFSREELLTAVRSRLARAERVIQEREQRIGELRESLLYRLPHELRTPLVGILGIGELLSQDAHLLTADEITEYADIIKISGQQLYRLIENHLLYAQLESQGPDLAECSDSDHDALTAAAAVIQETAERLIVEYRREASLELDLQMGTVRLLNTNLTKIVYELVDNACKFSASATTIQVVGRVAGDHYRLQVRDQGRGIAEENLAKIGPFVQFDRARYEQPGSGLGLVIVRRLVNLVGGTFQIASTLAVGTVATVTLPLAV